MTTLSIMLCIENADMSCLVSIYRFTRSAQGLEMDTYIKIKK